MTTTSRVLAGLWAVLVGYVVLLAVLAKIFGRVPMWAVSFLAVPYVGESIRYFIVLLLAPVSIVYGIRAIYRLGMKRSEPSRKS